MSYPRFVVLVKKVRRRGAGLSFARGPVARRDGAQAVSAAPRLRASAAPSSRLVAVT